MSTRSPFPMLLLLLSLAVLLVGAGPRKGPATRAERQEEQSWRQVEAAAARDAHDKTLDKAEDYLRSFPEGPHRLDARLIAGRAAMEQELWTACRRHLDAYLADGGRQQMQDVAYRVAICLAREGKTDDAAPALRNVAAHDDDDVRAAAAARELVALRLFEGEWPKALVAQGLLLGRGLFDPEADLADSRKAADQLGDGMLEVMERAEEDPLVAGLVAFLRLERAGQLLEAAETRDARRRFADLYPEHPLIDQVPQAAEWASEPEDTDARAIGVLLPTSGRYAAPGQLALQGVQLAFDRIRADESLGMTDLKLVHIDTGGDPEAAVEGLKRLVEVDRVIAVIGPIISAEAEAVAAAADEVGVPILMMTHKAGLASSSHNLFNTLVSADEQVDALVDHAMDRMDIQTFAIAYPDRETGGRMAGRFWERVGERGGRVAAVEAYPSGSTDFRETARRVLGREYLRSAPSEADQVLPWLGDRQRPHITSPQVELEPGIDFQAVFVPDNYKIGAMLAPGFLYEQINMGGALSETRGLPVALLGPAAFNHSDLVERGGKYSEGTVFVDGFFVHSLDASVQDFVLHYRRAHGADPSALEAIAYDSARFLVQLLLEGVESRREMRSRLSIAAPVRSVVGARGFGPDREMRHDLLVLRVKKGKIVQVWPEPLQQPIHLELTEDGEVLRYRIGPDGKRVIVTEEEIEGGSAGSGSAAPEEPQEGTAAPEEPQEEESAP